MGDYFRGLAFAIVYVDGIVQLSQCMEDQVRHFHELLLRMWTWRSRLTNVDSIIRNWSRSAISSAPLGWKWMKISSGKFWRLRFEKMNTAQELPWYSRILQPVHKKIADSSAVPRPWGDNGENWCRRILRISQIEAVNAFVSFLSWLRIPWSYRKGPFLGCFRSFIGLEEGLWKVVSHLPRVAYNDRAKAPFNERKELAVVFTLTEFRILPLSEEPFAV